MRENAWHLASRRTHETQNEYQIVHMYPIRKQKTGFCPGEVNWRIMFVGNTIHPIQCFFCGFWKSHSELGLFAEMEWYLYLSYFPFPISSFALCPFSLSLSLSLCLCVSLPNLSTVSHTNIFRVSKVLFFQSLKGWPIVKRLKEFVAFQRQISLKGFNSTKGFLHQMTRECQRFNCCFSYSQPRSIRNGFWELPPAKCRFELSGDHCNTI